MDNDNLIRQFFDRIRGMIEHEDELITRRISWFLTFNGFLFTAFGLTFGAAGAVVTAQAGSSSVELHGAIEATRVTMSAAGMITSLIVQVGTAAAYIAVAARSLEFKQFLISRFPVGTDLTLALRELGLPALMSPRDAVIEGMSPSIMLPLMACGVWFALGLESARRTECRMTIWSVGIISFMVLAVLIIQARRKRERSNVFATSSFHSNVLSTPHDSTSD